MRTGRIGRIRESFLPLLEIIGIAEGDLAKKVLSGTRNPRFRDEATLFECFRFVVKEIDDIVGDFWWETWMIWIRHRDPVKKADRSFDTSFEYAHLVA